MEIIPSVNSIAIELIYDLYLFLERNELEKCQLVCRRWHEIITSMFNFNFLHVWFLDHVNILPLRQHWRICFGGREHVVYFWPFDDFSNPGCTMTLENLRTSIFSELVLAYKFPQFSSALRRLVVSCGMKIKVKKVLCHFHYDKERNQKKLRKEILGVPFYYFIKIREKHVHVHFSKKF